MRALAFAKVNLALRVVSPAEHGLHRIRGLFQSIRWADSLMLETAEEDAITDSDGRAVIDGTRNLAWRAATAVRTAAGASARIHVVLDKRIPVAAGLGGGSADAAAALGAAGRMFGVDPGALAGLAPALGSDVPFCLAGGKAVVSGFGDVVDALDGGDRYGLALVVPPVEVSTAAVYEAWDGMGGPAGRELAGRDVPPALRDLAPLSNDLYPAAVSLVPQIDEWRAELTARWDRPVMMTGSGPTLFAFFLDEEEAEAALDVVPPGSRAAEAATPVDHGWQLVPD